MVAFDGTGTNVPRQIRRMCMVCAPPRPHASLPRLPRVRPSAVASAPPWPQAREAGFAVKVLYVKVRTETAIQRNEARKRQVPEETIRAYVSRLDEAVEAVVAHEEAEHRPVRWPWIDTWTAAAGQWTRLACLPLCLCASAPPYRRPPLACPLPLHASLAHAPGSLVDELVVFRNDEHDGISAAERWGDRWAQAVWRQSQARAAFLDGCTPDPVVFDY